MSLPVGVEAVTVSSGQPLTRPDGKPIKGRIIFTGPDLATIPEDDFTFGGKAIAHLEDGAFTVRLVANDATGLNPSGGAYMVETDFTNAPNWPTRYIHLTQASTDVVLSDVLIPDPVAGQYAVLADASTLLTKTQNLGDLPNPAAARDNLELGDAATADVGTEPGTVAAGDDGRLTNSRRPTGPAGGDLGGTYPDPKVVAVNGVAVSGTPTAGQVLTATGDAEAEWTDAAAGSAEWVFDVTDYGAFGDAQVVADGAMGAGVAVLTSATANWPSNVVGKAISVKGAGPNGVTTLVTTVASRQSATQITLNTVNASGGAVSGAVVIWGTDDTAKIQAAVDAAEAYLNSGHTYAQVYFPPRPYVIAGPLNTSKNGNGQIVFGVYVMTAVKKILEFASDVTGGAAVRTWLQGVPQYGGACLISFGLYSSTSAQIASINADGNPGVISGPNEGFGYGVAATFSNVLPVLTNISFLTAHSSFGLTYGAANFFGCANAHVKNFSTSTAGLVPGTDYSSPGVFGTGLSIGLLLPAPGNNDYVVVENASIGGGYTYACFLTEHAIVTRYMALYCWAGLVAVGTYFGSVGSVHAMKVLSASIEACVTELLILGAGSGGIGPIIDIDQLSTESSTPNIGGQAAHMAAARGIVRWTGLFTEAGLTHDQPTGIESINGQATSDVRTVTANTTARPIDRVIKADATSGGITVALPSAAPNPVTYTVIKADATGNTVTVDPFGSQTINGSATRILSAQWETVTLRSDGSNWIAI
jgi:hypothetical protein